MVLRTSNLNVLRTQWCFALLTQMCFASNGFSDMSNFTGSAQNLGGTGVRWVDNKIEPFYVKLKI